MVKITDNGHQAAELLHAVGEPLNRKVSAIIDWNARKSTERMKSISQGYWVLELVFIL